MRKPEKHYRWSHPYEWLADTARSWDKDTLYSELMNLASNTDSDTLQDLFQMQMDEDGYFTPVKS